MSANHFESFLFCLRATVSCVVAALSYKFFTSLPGVPWVAAVSAVMVTQPDFNSSLKASGLRVVANIAGAFSGAILLALTGKPILAMAVGVMFTGFMCHLFRQDDIQRTAFVAVIIVTLFGENGEWHNSFNRVFGTIIGCAGALLVGLIFKQIIAAIKKAHNRQTKS